MSAFEAFVNLELPRRSAFLTGAITGFDGDPNSGGAPAQLQGAPVGTWYLRETPLTVYRKLTAGATGWVEDGSSGGGGGTAGVVTETAMTIPVDWNDPTAADPPASSFSSQQDVDDFLSAQGASSIKHIQSAYDALPLFIRHTVTLELAAGVHRPLPSAGDIAFVLTSKTVLDGEGQLILQGDEPLNYDQVHAGGTVTGAQTGSNDPYMDFPASTFPNDGSLKGYFAVIDTGQTVLIHDHTDSRLYVITELSPDPTGSSVFVGSPNTILRNSIDDATKKSNFSILQISGGNLVDFFGLQLNDVKIDPFGVISNTVRWEQSVGIFLRVLLDQLDTSLGQVPNGNSLSVDGYGATLVAWHYSHIASTTSGGVDVPIFISNGGQFQTFEGVFIQGGEDGIFVSGSESVLILGSTILEGIGRNTVNPEFGAISIREGAKFISQEIGNGRPAEIRDIQNGVGALVFSTGGRVTSAFNLGFVFKNISGPCIRFSGGVQFPHTESSVFDFQDGGGNLDVGLEIIKSFNSATLTSTFSPSGAAGDLRIEGVVGSYGDLPTNDNPLRTTGLNVIGKDV